MGVPDYLVAGERARLIPVTADGNKELRAASILLATLSSVTPFAQELLGSVGQRIGKRARLECYTEVVFRDIADRPKDRPDGLLVLEGGSGRVWRCLVEAKIGRNELEAEQVERYLAIARAARLDAVLTISNQFVALPSHSPLSLPKSATKGVELYHWSWMSLLTQAQLLLGNDKVEPAEQRYILAETVRYFSHPSVGVSTFDRMNPEWKDVNAQVQAGAKLSKSAPAVENTVAAWHQEGRDTCLLLSRRIGRDVDLRLSRAHSADQVLRLKEDAATLADQLELSFQLDVPDAASPIAVVANLQRRSLEASMSLAAPDDRQSTKAKVNWLVRQLVSSDPAGIHIRARWPGRAPVTQKALTELREDPAAIEGDNRALVPSRFEVVLVRDLAGKFAGAKTFIEQLEMMVPYFYEQVGQHLRAYVAAPPRIRREETTAAAADEADRVEEIAAISAEESRAAVEEIGAGISNGNDGPKASQERSDKKGSAVVIPLAEEQVPAPRQNSSEAE